MIYDFIHERRRERFVLYSCLVLLMSSIIEIRNKRSHNLHRPPLIQIGLFTRQKRFDLKNRGLITISDLEFVQGTMKTSVTKDVAF